MSKATVEEAQALNDECYLLEQAFEAEREKRREAKANGKSPNKDKLTSMRDELEALRLRARRASVDAGLRSEGNTVVVTEEDK